jgi:hypothetical protein
LLQYQTPTLSSHNSNYETDFKLKFMFQDKISVDLLLWGKIIKK